MDDFGAPIEAWETMAAALIALYLVAAICFLRWCSRAAPADGESER